jgi:hypothetical protein
MRYFGKFLSLTKYLMSSGYLIKKMHLSENVKVKIRRKKLKNNISSTRGRKLLSLAEKVEVRKIIKHSDPLFFQVSRLYFNNLYEGLSRYAKEFSYTEFEKILTNPNYVKFIALNNKQPVGVLVMTNNAKLLMNDIWLDEQYFNNRVVSSEKMKRYWVSQSFVDKKERNEKVFSALIVKAFQFCKKENAMIFFDWAVESTPYLPTLIKSIGKDIGIALEGRNISCEICSVYWTKYK